jgi:hypothetical protein
MTSRLLSASGIFIGLKRFFVATGVILCGNWGTAGLGHFRKIGAD